MATQRRIQIEADKKNREQRNVRERYLFSIKDYWARTNIKGNTVITGGTPEKRLLVLEGLIEQCMLDKVPTVVIVNTWEYSEFDNELIEILKKVPDVNLIITSDTYNNYSFFEGWPLSKIVDYFMACNKDQNINMTNLANLATYITYYFFLVEKIYGKVTFSTLEKAIDERDHDSENVETLCRKINAEDMDNHIQEMINYLKRANEERNTMETLFLKIRDTLKQLDAGGMGYSLVSHKFAPGDIFVIHTEKTSNFELLSLYIKYEINQMLNLPFQLIIGECINEELLVCLSDKIKNGNTIGVCAQSVRTIWGEKIKDFPFSNIVILTRNKQNSLPSNLETELELLGQFNYYEPIMTGGSPPVGFSFWTDTHITTIKTAANKVMMEDVGKNEAVLCGHGNIFSKNEIALVRYFCN